MPRAKPNPYAALRPIVEQLGQLTHDELRDLVDMLQADRATDHFEFPKRYGLPPVDPRNRHALIIYGGWQYRDNPPRFTEAARRELSQVYEVLEALTPEARRLMEDVAIQLRLALQPAPELRQRGDSPIADGDIQARYITRKKWDNDLQQVVTVSSGPYLYYRYWTSSGDKTKRKKRLATEYIGQQSLALVYDQTPTHSEERRALKARIIVAHKGGTMDALLDGLGLLDPPLEHPPVSSNETPEED